MPSLRAFCRRAALASAALLCVRAADRRPLNLDDLARLEEVSDPRVSPDGRWIVYSVARVDTAADKRESHLWMVSWDGKESVQLTFGSEAASAARWSPDGRYLSFLSSRPGPAKGSQVWVLDRRGGEAHQLTAVKGKLSAYEWAPDSKRLALVMSETTEPEPDPKKPAVDQPPPKPIVIDRYHFKQDREGYLSGTDRARIYLYDIEPKKLDALTGDKEHDEENPTWSPDGSQIAFVSNHDKDWDRTENTDVFVTDAKPSSPPRKLTAFEGTDGGRLSWSPDSATIGFVEGSEPKYNAYSMNRLFVVPARGGAPRLLSAKLDRGVSSPSFSPDGRSITVLVADDRSEYPARVDLSGSAVERLVGGSLVVMAQSQAAGHTALLAASDNAPPEVFALDGGSLRKLTSRNDALMSELKLGSTEDITFRSKDGAEVHGLLTKPVDYEPGKKYPTLLRIHGGPNGQDSHAFQFERQFFAANGYAVINVNYRGSAGRGADFSHSIFADWGNKEVADLLAAVDHVLSTGVAAPDRLGIGGWSYGGILTDYTIASDSRFKAAISGAGSANQITMYGVDQYTVQYDNEIGPPWRSLDKWIAISYPFFHADRIHTPTLFMGGDKDFNVPLVGGEQMYQALRTLGVPTELVVYPGQFHGFTRPNFIRDRYQRYLAWYDKYLKPAATVAQSTQPAPTPSSQP